MNWVGPVLLTKCLSKGGSSVTPKVVSSIRMVKQKAGRTDGGPVFKRKLSFSPFDVTTLRREDFEGDRLGYWNGDKTTLFDPEHRVENCEMPNYWLQKALPPDVLDPPSAAPKSRSKKRKQQTEPSSEPVETVGARKKKPRKVPRSNTTGRQSSPTTTSAPSYVTPRRQSRPRPAIDRTEDIIEISDSDEELRLPPSRLLQKSSAQSVVSRVVDLGSPSSSDEAADVIARGISQKAAGLQRADRLGHAREVSPISFYGIDDERDFQIASRLSVREPNAAPSIPGERYLNRSSDPRRDQDLMQALREPTIFGAYNAPAAHVEFSSMASLQRKEADMLNSPSYVSQTSSASLERTTARIAHPTSPALEDVRTARLRHFQSSSTAAPTAGGHPGVAQSNVTPRRPVPPAFLVPAGTDCIDLTDD